MNPRGYYEWEPAKLLSQQPQRIAEAEGKAVKVISSLLVALPTGHDYRVLFMLRPIEEVVASQAAMIEQLGTKGPALPREMMAAALRGHLAESNAWLDRQPRLATHRVRYHDRCASRSRSGSRLRLRRVVSGRGSHGAAGGRNSVSVEVRGPTERR